jgi:hypothetical protein
VSLRGLSGDNWRKIERVAPEPLRWTLTDGACPQSPPRGSSHLPLPTITIVLAQGSDKLTVWNLIT